MRISVLLFTALVLVSGCCTRGASGGLGAGSGDDGNIPLAEGSDILKDVHFAFDSAKLDQQAKASLTESAKWLQENGSNSVAIEGHCDERGTAEYNMALGERRATSVYNYLRSLGVSSERMSTVSYGEELPLDPGHNEAAWAKNRRAHMKVN